VLSLSLLLSSVLGLAELNRPSCGFECGFGLAEAKAQIQLGRNKYWALFGLGAWQFWIMPSLVWFGSVRFDLIWEV
jgi:hypothetical protein